MFTSAQQYVELGAEGAVAVVYQVLHGVICVVEVYEQVSGHRTLPLAFSHFRCAVSIVKNCEVVGRMCPGFPLRSTWQIRDWG